MAYIRHLDGLILSFVVLCKSYLTSLIVFSVVNDFPSSNSTLCVYKIHNTGFSFYCMPRLLRYIGYYIVSLTSYRCSVVLAHFVLVVLMWSIELVGTRRLTGGALCNILEGDEWGEESYDIWQSHILQLHLRPRKCCVQVCCTGS